jgi:hypothetical protein
MGSGGAFADHQRIRDLLVGKALGHQGQDLALPLGQSIRRLRLGGHQRPRQLLRGPRLVTLPG